MKNKSFKKQIMMIALLALFAMAGNVYALDMKFVRTWATTDPATSKTVTWMTDQVSSPKAIMRMAKQSEGTGSYKEYNGKTMQITYNTAYLSSAGAEIYKTAYSVTVTGLTPGTTYIYQVGDGSSWSKQMEFTTDVANVSKYTFYTLGDLQAYGGNTTTLVAGSTKWLRDIANTYSSVKPLFSIQVGDIVDREHVYYCYQMFGDVNDAYPAFANTDIIAAMGNHEYYRGIGTANFSGSGRGDISKFLYGIPAQNSGNTGSGTFYTDYANMRIFTLDFIGRDGEGTPTAKLNDMATWLRNNLKNCNKTWKVINIHYPIYYEGTDYSQPYPSMATTLGSICDEYGVNVVFQGHVHTTRRMQVKNGTVTGRGCTFQGGVGQINTAANGTTYITCGNLADNQESSVYIRGEVDGTTMKLIMTTQGGNIRDNLTITTSAPPPPTLTLGFSSIPNNDPYIPVSSPFNYGYNSNLIYLTINDGSGYKSRLHCTLTSSDPNVATIAADGTISLVGNGTTTIKAVRDLPGPNNDGPKDGATGNINLTVNGGPTGVTNVSVSPSTLSLNVSGTSTLTATVSPSTAVNKDVTWSISDPTIATVDNTGKVSAIAEGTATITAASVENPTIKGSCELIVTDSDPVAVTGVSVSPSTLSLDVDGTSTLIANVSPSDATNKNVTWSSSNPIIATVDNNTGKVTAVAEGTATITAASVENPTIKGSCSVTVKIAPPTANGQLTLKIVARKPPGEQATVDDPALTVLTANTDASVTGSGNVFINDTGTKAPVTRDPALGTSYEVYPAGMATVSMYGGISTFGDCMLTIKATNAGRSGIITIQVGDGGSVGINTPVANEIKVSPTETGIFAEFEGTATVELYTINGVLIDKAKAFHSYSRHLAKGIYVIRINGQAVKFVK